MPCIHLLFFSPDSVVSEICTLEIEHAIQHNKRLVPSSTMWQMITFCRVSTQKVWINDGDDTLYYLQPVRKIKPSIVRSLNT